MEKQAKPSKENITKYGFFFGPKKNNMYKKKLRNKITYSIYTSNKKNLNFLQKYVSY